MSKTVFVGLSGGVDSSVTASLLKEQGFDVVGVYMKNWAQDLPGFDCPWRDDLADAKRVAVQLGIKFELFDFQNEYKQKVVDYMLAAYASGITPNPDIMCNQEIKFKVFLETALERGADMIATGHYAKTEGGKLFKAKDEKKDQTYFLYRATEGALEKTLFPLGDFTKTEVRALAEDRNLVTARKKESMGICFVGKVGIKEFLSQFIETKPGQIIDEKGVVVGEHDGAIFFTIGQRHGLNVAHGLPTYVVGKDMDKNVVYITADIDDERLWQSSVTLSAWHSINGDPSITQEYMLRFRHLGELTPATLTEFDGSTATISFAKPMRAVTPGQSMVFYEGERVVGGGIVAKTV